MTKNQGQKRYLSDRATKELFQIKEFRDKIIGGILGDKITKDELQALDIRINNNANFRDSRLDFGYEIVALLLMLSVIMIIVRKVKTKTLLTLIS